MSAQKVAVPLSISQINLGAAVMARAFHADPFFNFVLPDPIKRARLLPWLFEKTIRYGQRYGRTFTTPAMEGIALWLGPKQTALTGLGAIRAGLFLLPLKLTWQELKRSLSLADCAERLHKESVSGRHWYLYGLGVEPDQQGYGVGRALMQPILAQADATSLACYLDTNNEKNIPIYERYGFVVVQHAQTSRTGPNIWAMRRDPAR